jgi:hypothetical protein
MENLEMLPITPGKTRSALEDRSEHRFVDRDEFVRLLVSSKNLTRVDEDTSGLRGLFDVDANCTFLIDEDELFDGELNSPPSQH